MADLRGTTIGPYRIDELLGTGGFAVVYRGRDQRLDTDVAIKVLADNHSLDPDIRERFLGEAQVLRQVDSAEILTVYDIGETDQGSPYLVLELADRGDLQSRVIDRRKAGWVPTATDLTMVADLLASALSALHGNRIVHRDITPNNLLIRSTHTRDARGSNDALVGADERLLLGDLGLAKDLAARSGITVGSGTSGFAAPEQRKPAATVDERADVYGASALMLWLITGTSPGEGVPPAAPAMLNDDTHAALMRGLANNPADRQPSIEAWREGLGRFAWPAPVSAAQPPTNAESSTPSSSKPTPGAPSAQPRTLRWAGLVAVVVALAVVAALAFSLLTDDSDLQRSVRTDGLVTFTDAENASSLSVSGPENSPLGRVEYLIEAEGMRTWTVTSPSGESFVDAPAVAVTATAPGDATVRVDGIATDGTELTTEITTTFSG